MNLKTLVTLAMLVAASGCDRVHVSSSAAAPGDAPVSAPISQTAEAAVTTARADYFTYGDNDREKQTIAACQGVKRNGPALQIRENGQQVASLNDAAPKSFWLFVKCFTAPGKDGTDINYFVFENARDIEDVRYSLIVASNGTPVAWLPSEIQVYQGPLLAGGYIGEDASDFYIRDWTRPEHAAYHFEQPCIPDEWKSATKLIARCGENYETAEPTIIRRLGADWRVGLDGKPVKAKAETPLTPDNIKTLAEFGFLPAKT